LLVHYRSQRASAWFAAWGLLFSYEDSADLRVVLRDDADFVYNRAGLSVGAGLYLKS
jgi:hypothetical protein